MQRGAPLRLDHLERVGLREVVLRALREDGPDAWAAVVVALFRDPPDLVAIGSQGQYRSSTLYAGMSPGRRPVPAHRVDPTVIAASVIASHQRRNEGSSRGASSSSPADVAPTTEAIPARTSYRRELSSVRSRASARPSQSVPAAQSAPGRDGKRVRAHTCVCVCVCVFVERR